MPVCLACVGTYIAIKPIMLALPVFLKLSSLSTFNVPFQGGN